MAKWKCGICGSNFENFHAQGFNNKIYCPLCYFKKENQELKKQVLENKDNYNCLLKQKEQFEYIMSKQVDYQGQQKEFIKYLEDEIKRINPKDLDIGELNLRLDDIKFTQYLIYKEILQKYKSIIGVSDDNKTDV